MKLRIKGNSIRFRLAKSEVDYFGKHGYLEEKIEFGNTTFCYALKSDSSIENLAATLDANKLTLSVPSSIAKEWTSTQKVGFENALNIGNSKELFLLVEKDFKCLDETMEDQSDNYENPMATKRHSK